MRARLKMYYHYYTAYIDKYASVWFPPPILLPTYDRNHVERTRRCCLVVGSHT